MWQHVLSQTSCSCKLCGASAAEKEAQLEHYFVLCPAISELRQEAEVTQSLEDIQYPEPKDFPKVLAFVASVLERHRWQATDFDQRSEEKDEKVEAEEEKMATEDKVEPVEKTHVEQMDQRLAQNQIDQSPIPPPNRPVRRSYDDSPLGQLKEKILGEVAANRVTIIVAPTGCGKSTRSSL